MKARAGSAAPRALLAAIPLALVLLSGTAGAQDREADAERLFREGQKLMEERRFGEACPKFEAAYTEDHSLGTLLNLAFCHKEQGATWYAWLEFREAEVKATELNRPDRRDFAKQRLTELEKQLPKVVIDNPQKLVLTDILVEDRKVFEAERGAVFAAESGQRRFIFKAKGKKNGVAMINVAKGDRVQHVSVPDLEDAPEPVARTADPGDHEGREGRGKGSAPPVAEDPDAGARQRTFGWIALVVGVAGATVGAIEGLSTYGSNCAGGKICKPDDKTSATTSAWVSDIGFAVGILGVGGGLYLLLTAPSASSQPTPAAQVRSPGAHPVRAPGVTVTPRLGLGWAGLSGSF